MTKRLQPVHLWAWRYQSGPRSVMEYLQFMATPDSCDVLVRAFDELARTASPAVRTFPLRELRVQYDPTGFSQNYVWFSKLRIQVVADDPELQQLHVFTGRDEAFIVVHPQFLPRLKDALESLKQGGADFALGPETRGRKGRTFQAGERDRSSLWLLFWQPIRGTLESSPKQ